MTNENGDVIDTTGETSTEYYGYDAFGIAETNTTIDNPYRYKSARYDEASGLYTMDGKDYDCMTGLYLERNTACLLYTSRCV